MKIGHYVMIFIVVVVAGIISMKFLGGGPTTTTKITKSEIATDDPIPVPNENPPHPRAEFAEKVHDFGIMTLGEEGSHAFRITNTGKANLVMVAREDDTSCQCTMGELGKGGLKPGEWTEAVLKWTIKSPSARFNHFAKIRTNDPDNTVIELRIQGMIGHEIRVSPATDWRVDIMSEDRENPSEVFGNIHSETHDAFKIVKIEAADPSWVNVTTEPLDAETLKMLNADPKRFFAMDMVDGDKAPQVADDIDSPKAKCGYKIIVKVLPNMPVGAFRTKLTIHTDLEDAKTATVYVVGSRSGPVQFFGRGWTSGLMLLSLRRFPAAIGQKRTIKMFVNSFDKEFKVTDIKTDPPFMKVTAKKIAKATKSDKDVFDIEVEVPPNSPPTARDSNRPGKIILFTNHPDAKTIEISVRFISL